MNGCVRAINRTRGTSLCDKIENAGSLSGRSRALLGRAALLPGRGMLFVRGRFEPFMWMHRFFMRFAINIVFLDRQDRVGLSHTLKPWRVSAVITAPELEAVSALRSGAKVGDSITFELAKIAGTLTNLSPVHGSCLA
jgi:uncharacterized membrane protein (UPF0127 family)